MLQKIKWLLKHLFTLPWSPEGRKMRIERLMRSTGRERDAAAAIVYYRDIKRHIWMREDEMEDFKRICGRLERNEITLPIDRMGKELDRGKN